MKNSSRNVVFKTGNFSTCAVIDFSGFRLVDFNLRLYLWTARHLAAESSVNEETQRICISEQRWALSFSLPCLLSGALFWKAPKMSSYKNLFYFWNSLLYIDSCDIKSLKELWWNAIQNIGSFSYIGVGVKSRSTFRALLKSTTRGRKAWKYFSGPQMFKSISSPIKLLVPCQYLECQGVTKWKQANEKYFHRLLWPHPTTS